MDDRQGSGRLARGRERFVRAMMEIQFDSGRWLAQFEAAAPAAVQRVLLATAPGEAPLPGLQGMELHPAAHAGSGVSAEVRVTSDAVTSDR